MGGFKPKRLPFGGRDGDDGASDSVSELSAGSSSTLHTNSTDVSMSKSRVSPLRILRAGTKFAGKMKGSSHSGGSDSTKATDSNSAHAANAPPSSVGVDVGTSEVSVGSAARTNLMKNAKSRFNIGIVYLKTGDYDKAQENLEKSLSCHMQLSGQDVKSYSPDTLLAIAGVHEKLGDCFTANSVISDKRLALNHYEDARKLLCIVETEDSDAPEHIQMKEMLERVNEQLKLLLPNSMQEGSPRRPVANVNKYEMKANDKAKALLGFGALATAVRITVTPPKPAETKKPCIIGKGIEKIHHGIHEFANDIKEGMLERSGSHELLSDTDAQSFARAISFLDRNDHRTAFNYLKSMQVENSMINPDFRAKIESALMTVASSALKAGKNGVATDAYEDLHTLLMQSTGLNSMIINRGCIKSHKAMALEMESMMDYESAIEKRIRVKELLDENDKFIPACKQLMKIAYLHGEMNCDYDKCSSILADVVRRILERSPPLDLMPVERLDLLIQCYHMGAICYSKARKWNEAIQQYDTLLPIIARTKGVECREYNSASIQMAALLVKTGQYDHALNAVIKYFDLAEKSTNAIVDDSDHILALDVYTALLLYIGNLDTAKDVLERKLTFLDRLPKNDELKSDTMHKLGCLLAFKKEHHLAVPMLNEALERRKRMHDGRHKAVFETMWAVATSAQSLGDTERSLNAYSELVNKKNSVEDLPVDIIRVHNSAGKLYFEDGHANKSVASFRHAVKEAETRRDDDQKHVAELNLANALSSVGMSGEAMELYDKLVSKKALKLSKIFFLALVNKSALLFSLGQVEDAYKILCNIEDTHSANADDVRGRVYLLLGSIALANGQFNAARSYFEDSLDVADDDLSTIVKAKKGISLSHLLSMQYERAITTLDDLLEDISAQNAESKSANITKAEIWNLMAQVYKKQGNLLQAKNFAKLALQTFKSVLGETHPTTLRNVSNLQVLLLEEAEGLDNSEAKFFIDVAKYELEDTLDAFESMNDPWTHRIDMVSLRINLGFIAVWQGKPKKARKYLRQIKEVEIPSGHLLMQQIVNLENCIVQLEKKRLSRTLHVN